jgi:glycosyltransferase involved in cell wall biosynthesis
MTTVSVVVPCLNEARYVAQLLDSLAHQDLGDFEIVLVDGGSIDGTPRIAQRWLAENPTVRLCLLHNPARFTSHALNLGIAAARGGVIVRLDAHARPAPDYVRQCLAVLAETGAAIVGGVWSVRPGANTPMARAIGLAVSSPLGAGDARYRLSGARAGEVDTVPFGCYRRQVWEAVGGYNEAWLSNEDYEFYLRVRAQGGRVLFDPRIRCDYFARPTLPELATQYWRYGWWRAQTLKAYPRSLRLRQALPLVWSVGSLVLLSLAPWDRAAAIAGLAVWGVYLAIVAAGASGLAGRAREPGVGLRLAVAFTVIHYAWGLGAWAGFLQARAIRA